MSVYKKSDYTKGTMKLNILLATRKLLITALIKTKWSPKEAFKLNYPTAYITYEHYRKQLRKHQICVKTKSYVEIRSMN